MTNSNCWTADGGCTCGEIRYRMNLKPIYVHCCHCSWCQRQSGSAFAVNAMIETSAVKFLTGTPETLKIPSPSGKGQTFKRCPTCRIALYSHYAGAGEALAFIRVGTLDTPNLCPPDIHIFTSSKQPWVQIPIGIPVYEEFYDRKTVWAPEMLARAQAAH